MRVRVCVFTRIVVRTLQKQRFGGLRTIKQKNKTRQQNAHMAHRKGHSDAETEDSGSVRTITASELAIFKCFANERVSDLTKRAPTSREFLKRAKKERQREEEECERNEQRTAGRAHRLDRIDEEDDEGNEGTEYPQERSHNRRHRESERNENDRERERDRDRDSEGEKDNRRRTDRRTHTGDRNQTRDRDSRDRDRDRKRDAYSAVSAASSKVSSDGGSGHSRLDRGFTRGSAQVIQATDHGDATCEPEPLPDLETSPPPHEPLLPADVDVVDVAVAPPSPLPMPSILPLPSLPAPLPHAPRSVFSIMPPSVGPPPATRPPSRAPSQTAAAGLPREQPAPYFASFGGGHDSGANPDPQQTLGDAMRRPFDLPPPSNAAEVAAENSDRMMVIKKKDILIELEKMELEGRYKPRGPRLTTKDSFAEIQYEYNAAEIDANAISMVSTAKMAVTLGSALLEGTNFSLLQGVQDAITKDMTRFDRPLTRLYKKHFRRWTVTPEAELAGLVLAPIAWVAFSNWRGKTPNTGASNTAGATSAVPQPFEASFTGREQDKGAEGADDVDTPAYTTLYPPTVELGVGAVPRRNPTVVQSPPALTNAPSATATAAAAATSDEKVRESERHDAKERDRAELAKAKRVLEEVDMQTRATRNQLRALKDEINTSRREFEREMARKQESFALQLRQNEPTNKGKGNSTTAPDSDDDDATYNTHNNDGDDANEQDADDADTNEHSDESELEDEEDEEDDHTPPPPPPPPRLPQPVRHIVLGSGADKKSRLGNEKQTPKQQQQQQPKQTAPVRTRPVAAVPRKASAQRVSALMQQHKSDSDNDSDNTTNLLPPNRKPAKHKKKATPRTDDESDGELDISAMQQTLANAVKSGTPRVATRTMPSSEDEDGEKDEDEDEDEDKDKEWF
jgi:hypothetical protein